MSMKMMHFMVLFLMMLASSSAASVQLDAVGFRREIAESTAAGVRWFVFFFSPQCGHCRAMEPAWEELSVRLDHVAIISGSGEKLYEPVRLATIDATVEKALAESLDVNGYPTLLAIDPSTRAVYEYDGDRSAGSLHAFATHADPAEAGGRRRGYMSHDGSVRPSLLDVLRRVPTDCNEIVSIALGTNGAAAALVAAFLMALGALIGLACTPPPSTAFLVVECPPGVTGGQTFVVEWTAGGCLGRRRKRVMKVAAPAGMTPGQSFFVPLIAPPTVRPVADEKRRAATESTNVADAQSKKSD